MTTADQVHELIHRSWNTPDGPARIAVAEQALDLAEALGDPDLAYSARSAATTAYHQGGEPMKCLMTFARNLADYDADPGRRSGQDEHLLLWHFKFVVSSMSKFPEVPLDRTLAVIEDMDRRYRAGGHSLHAVYAYRQRLAAHLGDTVLADHWFRMWDAAARDRNSDCVGCDPTSKAYYHAWRGNDEAAIEVAQGALSGQLTCSEQPQAVLTALMLPYARQGMLLQARDAHRRAYRAQTGNVADLGEMAVHLKFCGRTGNEVRGLELIERHLSWLDKAPTPMSEMEFAAAAAHILGRLTAAGKGDLAVRRAGGEISAAELADTLRTRAQGIAARFDARNGNTFQSGLVAEILDAEPIVDYLPLSVTAEHRPRAAAAPPVEPAPEVDLSGVPEDLEGKLALAERWNLDDDPRAKALAQRVTDEYAGADLTSVQRGRWAQLRALVTEDSEATAGLFEEAVRCFATGGDHLRWLIARERHALALVRVPGSTPEVVQPGLEAAEEALALCTDPAERRSLQSRAAYLCALVGRLDEAEAYIAAALAEPGLFPPKRRAQVVALRGQMAGQQGDLDQAIVHLRAAVDLLRPYGRSDELAGSLINLARALGMQGDHAGVLKAFEEAAAMAVDPDLARSARLDAAFMLVTTDRAAEVVDDIVEHICVMVAENADRPANYSRHRLALALLNTDRHREAAEVAEEALAWFLDDGDDADIVLELRRVLAHSYAALDEPTVALGQWELIAEQLTGFENLPVRADALRRAGELLWRLDRDAEAAQRFEAAAQAFGQADEAMGTVHSRRRMAMALHHAGEPERSAEAVEQLMALLEVTKAEPDDQAALTWERATAGYEAALILSNRDTPDYPLALRYVAAAPALYRSIEAYEEAFLAELRHGSVLVVASRQAEGEPLLRKVIDGLPAEHPARRDAAWWLARALDEQGESRQARKVRKEFDLPNED